MHLHGSAKIKVDLRKSDALWRFKETVPRISSRSTFPRIWGIKARAKHYYIGGGGGGEWEWRKKLERQRRVLILPLRTLFSSILGWFLGWLVARPTDHLSKTRTTPMQEKSTMFHSSSGSGGRLAPAYDTGDGCTDRNLVHSTGRQEHYVLYAPSYRRAPTLCTRR